VTALTHASAGQQHLHAAIGRIGQQQAPTHASTGAPANVRLPATATTTVLPKTAPEVKSTAHAITTTGGVSDAAPVLATKAPTGGGIAPTSLQQDGPPRPPPPPPPPPPSPQPHAPSKLTAEDVFGE